MPTGRPLGTEQYPPVDVSLQVAHLHKSKPTDFMGNGTMDALAGLGGHKGCMPLPINPTFPTLGY